MCPKSSIFVQMAPRKIIHIDMDSFFASVEIHDNPALAGLPVAVAHDLPRSVVSTASYEARKWGVHSAQPLATAKRLCPQLVVVEPRYQRYKQVSGQVHEIFAQYTSQIEPISLDEAFLDVTASMGNHAYAMDIASEIREKIHHATGLTASAGVSYCKLLAKIASDYRKPNGMTVVHPDRALQFLEKLPVKRIWGVGPKTAERLGEMGVFTCGQLRQVPLSLLKLTFGKMGQLYYEFARGIDERPVVNEWVRKSVSVENTFEEDIHTQAAATIHLYQLVLELERRLKKSGFEGRSLTLKVKFADFKQITRSLTTDHVLCSKREILPLAKQLLAKVDFADHPMRLMGIGVGRHGDADRQPRPDAEAWHTLEIPFEPY